MKNLLIVLFFGIIYISFSSFNRIKRDEIFEGGQPQISIDKKGIIRFAYGFENKIFCSTSLDNGETFSNPVLVATLQNMHLGMTRGPQLACSDKFSVISAMDKAGNIYWYMLNNITKEWKSMGQLNDIPNSAPEGLMSIAADSKDNFYAVWLDIRIKNSNQIYFSTLKANQNIWSKNTLAYSSPDGHVCECCKPNISVKDQEVSIMFRNWLGGSRDLYLLKSFDKGNSFKEVQKLGLETWKLNACPMDGGGIMIDKAGYNHTVWQRKGIIFYSQAGKPEINIGKGKNCSISGNNTEKIITFQSADTLKAIMLNKKQETIVGFGNSLKSMPLNDGKTLYVWEENKQIKFKKI